MDAGKYGRGAYALTGQAPASQRDIGGESGIRTRDTVSGIHTFQACSFNHSDTSPGNAVQSKTKKCCAALCDHTVNQLR
jgi:hypothetical protein